MIEENVCGQYEDAPPAQTLSGDAPIPTGERVLTHGPDDHRHDDDRER